MLFELILFLVNSRILLKGTTWRKEHRVCRETNRRKEFLPKYSTHYLKLNDASVKSFCFKSTCSVTCQNLRFTAPIHRCQCRNSSPAACCIFHCLHPKITVELLCSVYVFLPFPGTYMNLSAINELSRRVGFAFLFMRLFTMFGKHGDEAKPVGNFGVLFYPASPENIVKLLTHVISNGK